jgi:mono/diheme cytochrome c family protein
VNFRTFKKRAETSFQVGVGAIALLLLLASCKGSNNPNDVLTGVLPPVKAISGPDSFLLYPNPQSNPEMNTVTYAQAYYTAIDPSNAKDTLAKWKTANGFGSITGEETQSVFGDMRDLGYGRYVTARKNTDGTIAFLVDNYLVFSAAGYGYSNMNLDAAVARDQRWYIGTNAIEFSPGAQCATPLPNTLPECKPFAKYFTFDAATGARLLVANLDGRGDKAMPGICIVCHGGRGDELSPPDASGKQYFPLVGNPASAVRGDVKGKLHFFEPDTFSFSTLAGFKRSDQEPKIKTLNQWVLCTYPLASGVTSTYPEDACRTQAPLNEWQGGAAVVLKAAYGGDGMPNATFSDTYVPASWVAAGQSSLYQNVVQPTCRMCHILRGTGLESDISLSDFTSFQKSADRTKVHIIDKGNMPLTMVLYSRYWATPSMYNTLNAFLQLPDPSNNPSLSYTVLDSSGAPLLPGRPIADPGPSRVVGTLTTKLSAAGSLFADTYSWSIVSAPAGAATLDSNAIAQPTFTANAPGTYVVQLVAGKGSVQSAPSLQTIVVMNPASWPSVSGVYGGVTLPAAASGVHFSDIKLVLQHDGCLTCHVPQSTVPGIQNPPMMYGDIDRNLDGIVASGVAGTDDIWFHKEVLGRINFSDISASPLLRKPSGYHHHDGAPNLGNGILPGFGDPASGIHADQLQPGDPKRSLYDLFLNWILNGAPYN